MISGFLFGDSIYDNVYHEYHMKISEKTNPKKLKMKQSDKWIAIDKVQHFLYSFFITLGCQYVLVNKNDQSEKKALPISSAVSFSAGLLKEIQDSRGSRGFFSKKDMAANLAGIIFANMIILDKN